MSNYDTVEFLGIWETISNDEFNSAEFHLIKNEAAKKRLKKSEKENNSIKY